MVYNADMENFAEFCSFLSLVERHCALFQSTFFILCCFLVTLVTILRFLMVLDFHDGHIYYYHCLYYDQQIWALFHILKLQLNNRMVEMLVVSWANLSIPQTPFCIFALEVSSKRSQKFLNRRRAINNVRQKIFFGHR